MNDQGNHRWPEQEPGRGRHSQRPTGDDAGPQWPTGDEPARPARPPRHVRPQQPAQPPRQPQWPTGDDQPGAPRWPGESGQPARHARGGRQQPPPPGRRQPGPPPPGARPPGGPQQGGYRQPPPSQQRPGHPPAGAGAAGVEREPELITHRAYNGTGFDDGGRDDPYDDYDERWSEEDEQRFRETGLADDEDGTGRKGKGKAPLTPAQRKKRRWRRIRRSIYALVGLFLVLPALAFVITYFMVDVPSPSDVAQQQAKVVTYYYANGQEMGRDIPPDGGNRIILNSSDITPVVRHAIYSAEDATFETNPGFDITGIARAVFNQLTGGVGGGSTISQQYIKVATENDDYSYLRKWNELVKAFKMNNEQSKDEIITAYANTIYFGRGAYGIETAAQAYFNKHAKDLNASEASLLAGMIQQPGRSENEEVRLKRWTYVMDQMVANNWLSAAERDQATVPTLIPVEDSKPNAITGPNAYIEQRVKAELEAKGYPEEKIQAGGYRVYTTIDQRAQDLAVQAVDKVMGGQPQDLRKAIVAVDPKTGGVLAYYGGPREPGVDEIDWANTQRNPGSSFKPFDLVALLQRGKGLGETYDGSSPRTFGTVTVRNSDNEECKRCTVAEAMERSINTVFYDIVLNEVGPQAVVDAALAAGVPEQHGEKKTMGSVDGNISIGGGDTMVTPTDMAAAYATFAADGIQRETHFVTKLTTSDGEVLFDESTPGATEGTPAFSEDPEKSKQIAGNVTDSLKPVLTRSELTCAGGRECAGKTGTHQYVGPNGDKSINENAEAWMVGYTPQISASVWVGTGKNQPIRDASDRRVYGSGLPGEVWKEFMDSYLEGAPEMTFDQVDPIGQVPQAPPQDDSSYTPPSSTSSSSSSSSPPPVTSDVPPPESSQSEEILPTDEITPPDDETTTTESSESNSRPTWPLGRGQNGGG